MLRNLYTSALGAFLAAFALVGASVAVLSPFITPTNAQQITGSQLPYSGATSYTPDLLLGGANVGMTYDAQVGSYTIIGNHVFVDVFIDLSAEGSSTGAATVTLPLTAVSSTAEASCSIGRATGFTATTGAYVAYVITGTATAQLMQTGVTYANITQGNTQNTSTFLLSCVYRYQ